MNADGHEHLGPSDADAWLDAYIDGQMLQVDRAVFQERLAEDPALAAGIEMQRRLDRALGGLFVVPPFVGLPTNGHPAPEPTAAAATAIAAAQKAAVTTTPYNLILAGLAAVIVTAVTWLVYVNLANPRKSFETVYREQQAIISAGSGERCGMAEDPIFGGRAQLKKIPRAITIVRMSVEPVLSPQTLVISADVNGKTVVVFVDKAKNSDAGRKNITKQPNGLNVFQREGNGLRIYEITPFDKPKLLGLYDFPTMPADDAD